jgi:hypothetical protein
VGKMALVCLAVVFLALIVISAAVAGPLDDAVAAHQRGDYATAVRLLHPLADEGNALAQTGLGLMYEKGEGVLQDYAAAARWYRLAANQGQSDGQFRLGLLYYGGQGLPQDYAAAVKLIRPLADQGLDYAQTFLGVMYQLGQGVPQDYVRAHMWLNLSTAQGRSKAAAEGLDNVARLMTPAQIAEAQKLAREWQLSH